NGFNRLILKMCCQRRTKIRRVSCGLQRNRALQVDRTVHPARQKKMSFEQCSGLPESFYDLNFIHKKLFSRSSYLISENTQSTITITSVERPLNLISDSPLVQEIFDFIEEREGRADFSEITTSIFHLNNATEQLAASLVSDLIQNDPRFRVEEKRLVINADGAENRLLNELDYVVVDIEAVSGRSLPTKVIEIGACHVVRGQIIDTFEALVNPALPLTPFIAALTGINDEMLISAPMFHEVVEPWLSFAGDGVLVAHNSPFDISVLNQEIARVFPGCRMRNAELCTVQLARRLLPTLNNHHLDALADHFGVEIAQRHRAPGDARATAEILMRLLDELEIRGVRTLSQAREFHPERPMRNHVPLALDS